MCTIHAQSCQTPRSYVFPLCPLLVKFLPVSITDHAIRSLALKPVSSVFILLLHCLHVFPKSNLTILKTLRNKQTKPMVRHVYPPLPVPKSVTLFGFTEVKRSTR